MSNIDYFETKFLNKLSNKQKGATNAFLLMGDADSRPFSEVGDTLTDILDCIDEPLTVAYIATGKSHPNHTAVYNPRAPHVLTTAVNVVLDDLAMFEVLRFMFEIMQLKEQPAAFRLVTEHPSCGFINMNILYQRVASPSMATNEQYDDYITDMVNIIFPNLGCTAGTDHLHYDWELKVAE